VITLRRWLWVAGAPARVGLIGLIRLYRVTLSGWLGGQCKFYPSCSRYAEEAIRAHGAAWGVMLAGWRVVRCGPFTDGGLDPVRSRRPEAVQYEDIIHRPGRSEVSR